VQTACFGTNGQSGTDVVTRGGAGATVTRAQVPRPRGSACRRVWLLAGHPGDADAADLVNIELGVRDLGSADVDRRGAVGSI
jgi:hypothetical protein